MVEHKYWVIMIIIAALIGIIAANNPGKHKGHPTPIPTPTPTTTPPHVTLAWDISSGATGYRIWSSFASGQEQPFQDVGNNLIWTLQLNSGTTYFFEVTAYNAAGESLPSNEIIYTTP